MKTIPVPGRKIALGIATSLTCVIAIVNLAICGVAFYLAPNIRHLLLPVAMATIPVTWMMASTTQFVMLVSPFKLIETQKRDIFVAVRALLASFILFLSHIPGVAICCLVALLFFGLDFGVIVIASGVAAAAIVIASATQFATGLAFDRWEPQGGADGRDG